MAAHQTTPGDEIYGPGTDTEVLPVPVDARRVFEFLASSTPGFPKDPNAWSTVNFSGGSAPMIPSPIKAPVIAAALQAMCGLVVNELLELRDGKALLDSTVAVDTNHAGLWLGSTFTTYTNGLDVPALARTKKLASIFDRDFEQGFGQGLAGRTTALYQTKDPHVWYQLHGSLDAHKTLESMGIPTNVKFDTAKEYYNHIQKYIINWSPNEIEMHNVRHGLCGSICYTPAAWRNTIMGQRLNSHPLVNYDCQTYAAPTPKVPLPMATTDKRPLAGIKVLEMVRIIAGPTIGVTLASYGADVIRVNCSKLADLNVLQLTLNAGKRTIDLEITSTEDRALLDGLVADVDVFVQGFPESPRSHVVYTIVQEMVHPVSVGQILNNRYEIIKELGSGKYSTVWLARDQIYESYSAIKILRGDSESGKSDTFELAILKRLSEGNPNHTGYQHIACLLDHFMYGRHLCLVLEPMAENMKDFCFFFEDIKIPNSVLKRITKQLLSALDYAHSLGIIHTDIKQDNILIRIRDKSIIEKHLHRPQSSLGELNFDDPSEFSQVEVILSDWGTASWESLHLTEFIQPRLLRAPEVLLQAPWGKEVDIWNLGALLPELIDTVQMFSGRARVTGGDYRIKHHIEEVYALLGPFPSYLLAEGNQEIVRKIFNENLQIRDPIERPPAKLEKWIKCLCGEEKERFLLLLRSMLTIDPKNRKTAQLLQNEEWLTNQ
ncbi:hypothetical protein PITC_098500 [Penicillium italicum]|uniref:Protein kinase domain-containing protein n=1 Tax=Penicillium italicum TaxID=40296 RepID=A0A0A2L634_PENIT|nr:hypothetical protein PITC_098500 [Penicillium italicum]